MLSEKQNNFLRSNKNLPTPFQIIDLDMVAEQYKKFTTALPFCDIYYAVKSNANNDVIKTLIPLGSHFDTASIEEIKQVLALGADVKKLSFGTTIKKSSAIAESLALGIKLFVVDCDMELEKIAHEVAESGMDDVGIYCRMLHDGKDAGYPLNHKFGTTIKETIAILKKTKDVGLIPRGVSFHVGSQAKTATPWIDALKDVKKIFTALAEQDIMLDMINLGGGFPGHYRNSHDVESIEKISADISTAVKNLFADKKINYLIEPGRGMVSHAAVSVAEVILKSHKKNSGEWLYLDLGTYNGMFEAVDATIEHNIAPLFPIEGDTEPMILAGPTCDSGDCFYNKKTYDLPKNIKSGDRLIIFSTGSYSANIASTDFNGFRPIDVYSL
ncbi:MAG: type III PLP-dependent enzyme [Alphaproteobacteria bacterium]